MSYNYLLIENSNTLSYFDHLVENKQNPKLALYKNQRLVLLSYQPKNIFEYAELLWIKIKNFVLNIFNPILENNEKIEAIKKEINAYHFSKLNKTTMEPYQPSKELSELLAKTVVNCEKMDRFLKETRQTDKL